MATIQQAGVRCLMSLRTPVGAAPFVVQLPTGVAMQSQLTTLLSGGGGPPQVVIRSHEPEPITFACELPLPAPLADLLAKAARGEPAAISGTITLVTADFKAVMDIEFDDAPLTTAALSAMDAASREAGRMLLTVQPTEMRLHPRGGEAVTLPRPTPGTKRWLVSNFKLDIAGLETRRVAAVGAVVMQVKVESIRGIEQPRPTLVQRFPARIDGVLLQTSFSDRASWLDWEEQTRSAGSGAFKPSALLTLLAPNMSTVLGTVELQKIAIERFEIAHPNAANGPALAVKLFVSAIKWAL